MPSTPKRQHPDPITPAGPALRYARNKLRLSGEKLAVHAGVSRRTLIKIEQGDDTVAFGSYRKVAHALHLTELLEAFVGTSHYTAHQAPTNYITGSTALCIPSPDGSAPALWHSSSLSNPDTWQIAGSHITSTHHLLGAAGLWNATEMIGRYGVHLPCIWAATPERATFDLLIHHCEMNHCLVPNVQASDIDDVVRMEVVMEWVTQCKPSLSEQGTQIMEGWMNGG